MASNRAPKQWCMSKTETINSFENWRENLKYTLSLDPNFAPFLIAGTTWQKKSRAFPLRGLQDDDQDVPRELRKTAQQKVTLLELMLGQIANYCPIISRSTIVKNSVSIESIWQTIRAHYGFQSTGAHFLDFADIKLEIDERPEDLFQRLSAFIEDSLVLTNSGLTHHGDNPTEDEELSPSLENLIVLTWLRLIHSSLPRLVKQRYGTELRSRTLASIKPEISQALDSLLEELQATEDAKVMRSSMSNFRSHRAVKPQVTTKARPSKVCPLCKQAGRQGYDHFLSVCQFLPENDRKFLARARHTMSRDETVEVEAVSNEDLVQADDYCEPECNISSTRRVQVRQSPYLHVFHQQHSMRITIDSGAETNMIRESVARHIGAKISKSSQLAFQADGHSPLTVIGETRLIMCREHKQFILEALVVSNLEVDILAGVPFMALNDIAVRPAKHQVILGDGTCYEYSHTDINSSVHNVRRTQAFILRAPSSRSTIWPGEYIEIDTPSQLPRDSTFALEPRTDISKSAHVWPQPDIVTSVGGKLRIPNKSNTPIVVKKHEQICQVLPVYSPNGESPSKEVVQNVIPIKPSMKHSDNVVLDPNNQLSHEMKAQFQTLHTVYDTVFDPVPQGYNSGAGPFKAVVNMGPVLPPQRKGHMPQYNHDKMVELQTKFDDLEKIGVFKRPEDLGIVVEYLNPSFLIKKNNGGYRLVTAFADVGRYSKPQPSLMPDIDSTLRTIARWRYIIVSDLTSAFYQIPLSKDSMKYCGVATPFRGVRVYTRCAMGMPGSETALEELMCRVIGDLVQEGVVAKLADDLYCGGDSPTELLHNWQKVLKALQHCNIALSASKTIIAPKSTTILGWVWSQGTLQASPHRIATLSTCPLPETVKGLRSFIGAYKFLSRVLPDCAHILAPLEEFIGGLQSQDKISWTSELINTFTNAQSSLSKSKNIVLPNPNDQLWIVTDGATKHRGIGATLYVLRDSKPRLASFFSAKLRKHQITWIPCEIEALSIAASIKHFAPYIVQSKHTTCILTDSKPCVQAYEKLCRGEFSSSPRVSTFLSTVSRYQASIRHLAGTANLPSDFASRNAPDCSTFDCQMCKFIAQTEDSVVRHVTTQDVISGKASLPFTNIKVWLQTQSECSDLRRTHAHLKQGTRPSKKTTNAKDVKRYLNVAAISRDGLLVVRKDEPFAVSRECIIVPREIIDGLLTALHIQLEHPTCHQLKTVTRRYFYALDMDKSIELVSKSCHHCASLKSVQHMLKEQSSSDPPERLGVTFAADVIKRGKQLIFVLRESVSSLTNACIIENERHDTLRDAIIQLYIGLRSLDGPVAIIRTDAAPGFASLCNDELLNRYRIKVEIGRVKNPNKNPVADKLFANL